MKSEATEFYHTLRKFSIPSTFCPLRVKNVLEIMSDVLQILTKGCSYFATTRSFRCSKLFRHIGIYRRQSSSSKKAQEKTSRVAIIQLMDLYRPKLPAKEYFHLVVKILWCRIMSKITLSLSSSS